MTAKASFVFFIFTCLFLFQPVTAQPFAPPVGQSGTTAMDKDSLIFVNWATACHVTRGYQDISTPSLGFASAGDSTMATGKAMTNAVVSLGDGGMATCMFGKPVMNGPGYDFAVFENAFDDTFLELAFVEVSSDGINFFRFAAHSLTDTTVQTGPFGSTDATKINNLAGKYRTGYGTPFDLQELTDKPGLDVNAVTHVRVVDVVGSINRPYATYDSFGNKVNDPWPTGFASGGFDLDAIGVIHENATAGIPEAPDLKSFSIFPNPVEQQSVIYIQAPFDIISTELKDAGGRIILKGSGSQLSLPEITAGIYFLTIKTASANFVRKLVVF